MRKSHIASSLLCVLLAAASYAADAPTTMEAPRNVTAPAGFKREAVNGIHLLIDPTEEAWVKEAAKNFKPATRPGATPPEIAKNLSKDRAKIAAGLAADLALSSDKEILKSIDDQILPQLDKVEKGQPVFYYLPITESKLKEIVQAGWNGSRPGLEASRVQFYYNRHADTVEYNPNYMWQPGQDADESVVLLIFSPSEAQTVRVKALTDRFIAYEADRTDRVINEGRRRVVQAFEKMIDEIGIKPLGLTRGQQWLGMGVQAYLVAKYVAPVVVLEKDQILAEYAQRVQDVVHPATINLMEPTEEKILRKEVQPLYESAMRNKATAVVALWAKARGDEVIGKAMSAVRTKKPADAAALVKVINEATGTDLTSDLRIRN